MITREEARKHCGNYGIAKDFVSNCFICNCDLRKEYCIYMEKALMGEKGYLQNLGIAMAFCLPCWKKCAGKDWEFEE